MAKLKESVSALALIDAGVHPDDVDEWFREELTVIEKCGIFVRVELNGVQIWIEKENIK